MARRLAFVHLMRTGGTFINRQMQDCFAPESYHNSWSQGLERDWTAAELEQLSQASGESYVHNHVRNWTERLVHRFQESGFYVFCMIRDPRDQLCSLYYWLIAYWGSIDISLNDFLRLQIRGESYKDVSQSDWAIPGFVDDLDYVGLFPVREEGMTPSSWPALEHLRRFVGATVESEHAAPLNTSRNPGFHACLEQGLISEELDSILLASEATSQFRRLQSTLGVDR